MCEGINFPFDVKLSFVVFVQFFSASLILNIALARNGMMFMISGLSYHFRSTCFRIFSPYIIYLGSTQKLSECVLEEGSKKEDVQVVFSEKRFFLCLKQASQTTIMPFNVV